MWIARDSLATRREVVETLQKVAAQHFNSVYINGWSRGYPLWRSRVFQKHTGMLIDPTYEGRDILAEVLAEGHRLGLEVEVWMEYGFVGGFSGYFPSASGYGPIFDTHPEWLAKDRSGNAAFPISAGNFYWMVQARPDVQQFLVELVLELMAEYDIDGIEFDRLRYPSTDCGYDAYTVLLYQKEHGGQSPPQDADDAEWMRWRSEKLNAFAAALYNQVKARRPEITLSNAPAVYPFGYRNFLQDYPSWLREKALDYVTPQIYRRDSAGFTSELDKQLQEVPDSKALVPGLSATEAPPAEVAEMVRATRRRGLKGNVFWYYSALQDDFPVLRSQLFADPAPLPHRSPDWKRQVYEIKSDSGQVEITASAALYSVEVLQTGWYRLYASASPWPDGNPSAEYELFSSTGESAQATVNQRSAQSEGWNYLGEVFLESGRTTGFLRLNLVSGKAGERTYLSDALLIRSNKPARQEQIRFRIAPAGGHSILLQSLEGPVLVGHGRLSLQQGEGPEAAAVFQARKSENAQWMITGEAGVPAISPLRKFNVFAQSAGATSTGIAVSNPNAEAVELNFQLAGESGSVVAAAQRRLAPAAQMAVFLWELFAGAEVATGASLAVDSSLPVGAVALRTNTNARGDFLLTTVPIVSLEEGAGAALAPLVFPQVVSGAEFRTEILLMNPGPSAAEGEVAFRDRQGAEWMIATSRGSGPRFPYQIPPGGVWQLKTLDSGASPRAGYVMVAPRAGQAPPAGNALFSSFPGGVLISQAGVPSVPATTRARLFVSRRKAALEATETGIAIANTAGQEARVRLLLFADDGRRKFAEETLELAAGHQLARFLGELFTALPEQMNGVLTVESDRPVSILSLRATTNARGDFLMSTLPVVDLNRARPQGELRVIPHLGVGGGFSTELVLVSPSQDETAAGVIQFLDQRGNPLALAVK